MSNPVLTESSEAEGKGLARQPQPAVRGGTVTAALVGLCPARAGAPGSGRMLRDAATAPLRS